MSGANLVLAPAHLRIGLREDTGQKKTLLDPGQAKQGWRGNETVSGAGAAQSVEKNAIAQSYANPWDIGGPNPSANGVKFANRHACARAAWHSPPLFSRPMKPPIPVLRIFDEAKAKDHYIGYLGFKLDWEHRHAPGSPIYFQVSRDDCVLHLSEHFGDGSPGANLRIETPDIDAFSAELRGKDYKYAKPGPPKVQISGFRETTIADPSGNRLTFYGREKKA
jgi:hypothetical protein